MNNNTVENLQHTLHFLQSLLVEGNIRRETFKQDQTLVSTLINHLEMDGYGLKVFDGVFEHRQLQEGAVSGSSFYMDLVLIFICVLCAGLASGLTQGLLSLDFLEMKIKSQSGTPKEKEYSTKLLPIIKHHHLLLVTLMLWNASATEALPIFLNSLVPEYVAIIISVTLVLMFGEIIPASILTGPRQLEITASLTPLVYLVYVIFFPVAYPISKILDCVIGHEEGLTLYSRREIVTMMRMQHEEGMRRSQGGDAIRDTVHNDEIMIIGGALKYRDMKVSDVMTPADKVFMISAKENLSYKTLYDIFKSGYSRIPVYEKDRNDIVGLLLAKDLIFIDPEDETPISNFVEFFGRRPMTVWHDQLLGDVLQSFRRERAHLAIVRDVVFEGEGDPFYEVVGIITLEDIIEEILGTEIEDEFDHTEEEEQDQGYNWHLRDMDLARLKSLRSKITDDTLSEDEIHAIVRFLPKNVPQINQYIEKYHLSLQEVIQQSHVFLLKKQTVEGALQPHPNDIIVKKGKFTNTCILILQGRVKIVQEIENKEAVEGEEKMLHTEQIVGPWSTLCADALLSEDGIFTPNFSAYIHSNDLRFVRISTILTTLQPFPATTSAPSPSNPHRVPRRGAGGGGGFGRPERVLSGDAAAYRLRIASSPDSNYPLRPSKTHHGGGGGRSYNGLTGQQDLRESLLLQRDSSQLLRRSITTDVAFQPRRKEKDDHLSGLDEVASTNNTTDRKSILLAAVQPGKSDQIPIPGSSYNTSNASVASSMNNNNNNNQTGRSVSEYYERSDASRLSSSLLMREAVNTSNTPASIPRSSKISNTVTENKDNQSLLAPLIRAEEKGDNDGYISNQQQTVNALHQSQPSSKEQENK